MDVKAYLQQIFKSYWGALLVLGVPFTVGEFVVLSWPEFADGTLTLGRALHGVVVCAIGGAVISAFVHYALLKPFMKARGFTYEDIQREHERQRKG